VGVFSLSPVLGNLFPVNTHLLIILRLPAYCCTGFQPIPSSKVTRAVLAFQAGVTVCSSWAGVPFVSTKSGSFAIATRGHRIYSGGVLVYFSFGFRPADRAHACMMYDVIYQPVDMIRRGLYKGPTPCVKTSPFTAVRVVPGAPQFDSSTIGAVLVQGEPSIARHFFLVVVNWFRCLVWCVRPPLTTH